MARYGRNRGNPLIGLGIVLVVAVFYFIVSIFDPAYYAKQNKSGVSDAKFTTEAQSQTDFTLEKGYAGGTYDAPKARNTPVDKVSYTYVLNTNTMRIHQLNCSSVYEMADHNRSYTNKSIAELQAEGYVKCKRCFGG